MPRHSAEDDEFYSFRSRSSTTVSPNSRTQQRSHPSLKRNGISGSINRTDVRRNADSRPISSFQASTLQQSAPQSLNEGPGRRFKRGGSNKSPSAGEDPLAFDNMEEKSFRSEWWGSASFFSPAGRKPGRRSIDLTAGLRKSPAPVHAPAREVSDIGEPESIAFFATPRGRQESSCIPKFSGGNPHKVEKESLRSRFVAWRRRRRRTRGPTKLSASSLSRI